MTYAWSAHATVKSTAPPAQRISRHTSDEAVYWAASIERVCKLAYDVMLTAREPLKMNWSDMAGMQRSLIERAADVYRAGAARMNIKADPDVLT